MLQLQQVADLFAHMVCRDPITYLCNGKTVFWYRSTPLVYLQDPSQPGVTGGLYKWSEGAAPLVSPGFCQAAALIRDDCGCRGHSRGWLGALLSESSRAPLFLYYHKQIRGSGEHTHMQIAAERPISTLHHNGQSCMCRPSQPIKHKMNFM
ncbi:hypothetical protein GOODEAATRI_001555 [Goodea atripinnis]|uniref:Uncharacterized protein n=1 Tax=Goodea atripinnis TaxID=208336 RepID=A0ABV0MXU4_9TELE